MEENSDGYFAAPWWDVQTWFDPTTLQEYFSWERGQYLWMLLAVPLVFVIRWLISRRFRPRLAVAVPKGQLKKDPIALLRVLPNLLLMLCMALIIVALARPQSRFTEVETTSEGIDIMLVLDISQSMNIEDFQPNRLEAAKATAGRFVEGRFKDRIGVVIFAGEAFSLAPLTTDYPFLQNMLSQINFEMIRSRGTAIGSALAVATNRLRESEADSKVLILLSDGDNTAGNLDPLKAAELAAAFDIKIYTIAVGKDGKVPIGRDIFGQVRYTENTLDETTLRNIAQTGSGEFYRVSNNQALEAVFEQIDRLEKTEIKELQYQNITDHYRVYLYWAVVLFLAWLLLKSTFITNILRD